jgi:hypothetical protein
MFGHRFVQGYAFDQIKLALPGRCMSARMVAS